MGTNWTLIEEGSVLWISPNAEHRYPGTENIGSTTLKFRPRRQGSHRGETMVYCPFTDEDRAKARLIAAAPELLDDAKQNDNALTWLAEQMNSLTDNAKHWTVAQIENLAQDLRIGIEANQKRTRAAIAKAEGR
jgi:hypothetical protein